MSTSVEGLWVVRFTATASEGTEVRFGAGVCFLEKEQIYGGDGNFLYTGKYEVDKENFSAFVNVKKHSMAVESLVFLDEYAAVFRGKLANGKLSLRAKVREFTINIEGELNKELP